MENINAAIKDMKNKAVRIGWFKTAVYPDGTQVAYVATIQEMGSPEQNIPARPFIIPTYNKNHEAWEETLQDGADAIINGDVSAKDVLTALGGLIMNQIKVSITEVLDPRLANSTIQARLHKAGIFDVFVDDDNLHLILDENDKPLVYKVGDRQIGLLAKPLIDTGLMLASCTFRVGNANDSRYDD